MNNSQKTISFLSLVNSSLGPLNVNFDAETATESLDVNCFSKVYDLGLKWSETFQSTARTSASERASLIKQLLNKFGKRFSANLVIGNAAYGIDSNYRILRHMALRVALGSNEELKLGAEGLSNGKRAIDLAAQTGSFAYILHTSSVESLMEYSKERGVNFMVYTLLRMAETRSIAARELMRIKGSEYFVRRGVARDDVSQRLAGFSIFGSAEEIISQVLSFVNRGASKVVLFPVFENQRDLIDQLSMLSNCLE
jgi:hypothetical protein